MSAQEFIFQHQLKVNIPMKRLTLTLTLLFVTLYSLAQMAMPTILPMRERARVMDEILEERFTTLLPGMMEETGIDMWLVIAREYNEDPVIRTMLPATWLNARRRTILVIHNHPERGVEGLAIARYNVGNLFTSAWNPEEQPDQWERLVEVIQERDPETIGINVADIYNHADGLTHQEHEYLMEALPSKYAKRVQPAEELAVRWLETRTNRELAMYKQVNRIAHAIVDEALSERVIQPGATTTDDVEWWFRERVAELKLNTWFHPSCDITRPDPDNKEQNRSFSQRSGSSVIMPGDLVHIDFGITYLRMNTDTQRNAYVLKPGESAPPAGLLEAFQQGRRLQDIMTSKFRDGITGNEILSATRKQAIEEDITPSIYSHPIGYHGHAAGTSIGLWDNQNGIPTGEHPLQNNTAYAIELNARVYVPEWDKEIRVMLEEDAAYSNGKVYYIDGRQEQLYLIPRRVGVSEKINKYNER